MIAAFAAAWNAGEDGERLALLAWCCRPDAVVAAPQGLVTGIEVMSASIGEFRRAFPAAEVAFGVPVHYGEFGRVSWVTRWHDGRADLAGEDFAQFGADGRIGLLVSFDGMAAADHQHGREHGNGESARSNCGSAQIPRRVGGLGVGSSGRLLPW